MSGLGSSVDTVTPLEVGQFSLARNRLIRR